jgi:imidazole glycerol-phosphate synthase subunit HisF
MPRTRVIPVLLLRNGRLVKTVRFRKETYIGDPINTVKLFNDKEADEIAVLDIGATRERRPPDLKMIREIAGEAFMPLCYGGGITEVGQIREILGAGVEKIAINTAAQRNPRLIEEAAACFGSQSIIVSIDVKRSWLKGYEVITRGGGERTGKDPVAEAARLERLGAGEILLNSIDRDGTFGGYDLELIRRVSKAVCIPVIACGGARNSDDLAEAVRVGASAVAAGSMFVFLGPHRAVLISFTRFPSDVTDRGDTVPSPR